MVISVGSHRRSIRDAVLGGRRELYKPLRCASFYDGDAGGGIPSDGLAAALSEATGSVSLFGTDGGKKARNVLILMSDTGGGHRASAEALRDAFRLEYGDAYQVFVRDLGKEYGGWPLNDMERSYKFMIRHVRLWKVAFHGTSPRWVHGIYLAALAYFYANEVVAGIMKYKPDVIISVHPLMQHIPLWVLKWQSLQAKIPFFTVITDLNTCHPTWFHQGVTRCYCPSAEVAKRALIRGLQPSQIRVYGLPIRPSFCRAVLDKEELREELDMHPELPAVLLMGGGEGMGPVEETAMALGEELYDHRRRRPVGQIVVVCGRNQALWSTLRCLTWKVPVKIRRFEKQMEKWMGACDCIITKAGPGTIAEALIRGLPVILNDFIPGQEVGNVPYVVDNGAGVFCNDPMEAARQVARWFSTEAEDLKMYSHNALKLAQPEAVFDIIKDIHKLQQQPAALTRVPYSLTSSFSYHI
ncbi:probable monogalactosyldiacylglycerol synthase 2, chloroplastic [Lolium rigidum]|uniref:probable monogalactosyldiacylglycerol synthase 2, chloroplastic n=1 Tax=Lolium rigidum TaxID=89674 RepID=UPI001F5DEDBF|nr:probable monogalactosyldiacylglycerol synthase 2, chloroplastic [Lolium rigidum]